MHHSPPAPYTSTSTVEESEISLSSPPTKLIQKRTKTLTVSKDLLKKPPVIDFPGKKTGRKKLISRAPASTVINRYSKCKVIFRRKEDLQLGKIHNIALANECMGCDQEGCNYWVHVKCTGIRIKRETILETI